jgi:cellulose biosynthesis protein BcsQ
MVSTIIAADWFIIPVFPSGYDLKALELLMRTVSRVRERYNPGLRLAGEQEGEKVSKRPALRGQQPSVIRYQLNLTPKAKTMLEDLVRHVRTYGPQNDARVSEVFQGIVQLLHDAIDELELGELPRARSPGLG